MSTIRPLFLAIVFGLLSNAALSPRQDVTDPKGRVELALPALQTWYNTSTGLWETTGWWNSANIMTMIGDYAEAGPQDAELQGLAKDVFATAISCAPSKNPQPGIEDPPSNGTAPEGNNSTMHKSGYFKHLDPITYEPHAVYPPRWYDHSDGVLTTNNAAPNNVNCTPYAGTPDPNDWLDGFYDDNLWWALAWINAYDVTRQRSYLDLAEGIFLAVARTWGTYCSNGGIYWSYEEEYVNAIANELFFSTAAHLSTRIAERKGTYVDWAERSLDWFLSSGMINSNGTINDGLTDSCENNNRTVWSYNQGVILGGLVQLQLASPSPSDTYLTLAHSIATAAITELSGSNGVIHDECEPNCGADGAQFKGIFMRNLIQLHEAAPDENYAETIRANAESIWQNNRMSTQDGLAFFSVDWDGPFVESANASTHSSAMDALVAAVVLG
ncbi:glycoside hydrolase family 76 protein [Stemphylium lycopersici]|uniref:Glycoside hydrolase family 76 protein n=1 Tax=Stemphylium lycopersici TaxID=183478 RepID=A0A364MV10_STELY|nr:glycoside hydrolase family 76 protein [Stemphylium lycopersici]RAR04467.1 glycoside hydrolase family 76 protein [Stemphylium lycopersici]RAR04940.1 glycoside hydrolase family 76 protein [Stemphylium lycopersici]